NYLANIFAARFATIHGRRTEGFTSSALGAMAAHPWPGNVRELQNRIEYALVMGRGPKITTQDLFASEEVATVARTVTQAAPLEAESADPIRPYKEAKEHFEKQYVLGLMRQTQGNIAAAARLAGKYRTEVY